MSVQALNSPLLPPPTTKASSSRCRCRWSANALHALITALATVLVLSRSYVGTHL